MYGNFPFDEKKRYKRKTFGKPSHYLQVSPSLPEIGEGLQFHREKHNHSESIRDRRRYPVDKYARQEGWTVRRMFILQTLF